MTVSAVTCAIAKLLMMGAVGIPIEKVPEAPLFPAADPRAMPPPWDPGRVGRRRILEFTDGHRTMVTTLALRPRLFHLRRLLSDGEVAAILTTAPDANFTNSVVADGSGKGPKQSKGERRSSSQFIAAGYVPELSALLQRVADLMGIPRFWVQHSNLQVLRYGPGEFYKSHYDSMNLARFDRCHSSMQANGRPLDADGSATHCPRYATVLYYLGDVAEGGETCFPLADYAPVLNLPQAKWADLQRQAGFLQNASNRCSNRRPGCVFAAPRRGDAIAWYNHIPPGPGFDGPMGELDISALHMAMSVALKPSGVTKYAANHWLNVPWWPQTAPDLEQRHISESRESSRQKRRRRFDRDDL